MIFLISLCIVIFLIFIGRNFIKNHSNICYVITTLFSIALIFATYSGVISNTPTWIKDYVLPIFTKSSLATSIFVVVMYTGAFKNGSKLIKFLMPIRAQLSIIACILVLAHNAVYGKTHFVKLFTNPSSMATNMLIAAIISVILILIMLPLMITSFPKVRKKINPKVWKNIQKLAYIFYGLIYVHVMVITIPLAQKGIVPYIINIFVYSIVFLTYGAMRIRKALVKRKASSKKAASPFLASFIIFCLICVSIFHTSEKNINIETEILTSASQENSSNKENLNNDLSNTSENISYKDGTYIGSASGYNGNISVEVIIKNNSITDIKITDYVDDEPFINEALSGVSKYIVDAQNTDVDVVSGATYSSKGIINAVKAALIDAKD